MTFKDWVTSKWFQTPTLQSVNVARHSPDGLGRYLDYITGQTWQIDYVGKLENFQSDFNLVRTMIGLSVVTLPHINMAKESLGDRRVPICAFYGVMVNLIG